MFVDVRAQEGWRVYVCVCVFCCVRNVVKILRSYRSDAVAILEKIFSCMYL